MLQVSGISVKEEGIEILHGISFGIEEHQKIAIAGGTGSGKSTLLRTIAGLVQPSAGEIQLHNKKVKGPHDVLVPGHPEIAYLSQQFELPQFLRVEQVLSYTNTLSEEEAKTLYEVCRISHLTKRRTNQLSGGERQRIALARLLSSWPSLLLLDEPYSNLDMGHKTVLKSVISDISEALGITCVLISHDPLDTLSWADEIIVMQQGKLLQKGTPQHIYQQPINEYAASLFGKYNLLPAHEFASLVSTSKNGKSLLIRPESFSITTQSEGALQGIVKAKHYYGGYYELEVILGNTPVLIRSFTDEHTIGDTIYLAVDQDGISLV